MPQQLPLPFPSYPVSYAPHAFIRTPSNSEAFDYIETYPHWETPGLILTGPTKSGKTHLANLWCMKSQAKPLSTLTLEAIEPLLQQPLNVVLDDVDLASPEQEEALFHLYNALKAANKKMLVITNNPTLTQQVALQDLQSRLNSLMKLTLMDPDDELFMGIFLKRLSDAQLSIDPLALQYLLKRTERSYAAIHFWITTLEESVATNHRRITVPLIQSHMPT